MHHCDFLCYTSLKTSLQSCRSHKYSFTLPRLVCRDLFSFLQYTVAGLKIGAMLTVLTFRLFILFISVWLHYIQIGLSDCFDNEISLQSQIQGSKSQTRLFAILHHDFHSRFVLSYFRSPHEKCDRPAKSGKTGCLSNLISLICLCCACGMVLNPQLERAYSFQKQSKSLRIIICFKKMEMKKHYSDQETTEIQKAAFGILPQWYILWSCSDKVSIFFKSKKCCTIKYCLSHPQ